MNKNQKLAALLASSAKKPSKYRAVKTTVDGIRFDSAKEARRWSELKLLEKAGKIRALVRQPNFPLYVEQTCLGEYRADFAYLDIERGEQIVEDSKGVRTPLYRWKKRHVEAQYHRTILET